jgi:hypothetical protein
VKDIGISCQTYLSFNVRRSLQIPGAVVDLSSNRTSLASDLLANQIIEMNIRIPMTTFDNLPRYLQLKTTISQIISKCFTRENDNNSKIARIRQQKICFTSANSLAYHACVMSTEFISIAIKNTKTTTLRALLRQVRNTETVRKTHKNIDCNLIFHFPINCNLILSFMVRM